MTEIIIGKSAPIDRKVKPHLGMQVTKNGRLYGDKRCRYCGDWITWADVEPEYCFEGSVCKKTTGSGKQQCIDLYDIKVLNGTEDPARLEARTLRLMAMLKGRGLIA